MRVQSEPWAGGLLAALLWIAFVAWALASGGCAARTQIVVTHLRSPIEAASTAVAVKTECGWGSGVLVDSRHVYTAHHVIACGKGRLAKKVRVELPNGSSYTATYDALDASRDLARLRLPRAIGVPTLTVARVKPGQVVCAVTATPAREFRCGLVDVLKAPRVWGDVALKGMNLWFGNSGSGLYNTDGALVGIITRLYFCDEIDALLWELFEYRPKRTCGGRASSIEGPVAL
jgi:hypothetical protein